MGKNESNVVSIFILVISCILLAMAIWLSSVLRPPSVKRQSSVSRAHVITEDNPISFLDSSQKKNSQKPITLITPLSVEQRQQCYETCHVELVESLPDNLTFTDNLLINSTYDSWMKLINITQKRLIMAAYKSSFRGKHVLEEKYADAARLGDEIFDFLKSIASERGVRLEAVENYPPRDRGDNEDVSALHELGLMERRRLDPARFFRSGVMHSKFLLSDEAHFYLGSANFDWRSLNQKMELGVHVERCPCLGKDLKIIYDTHWAAAEETQISDQHFRDTPALTSRLNPLVISVGKADTEVHLAASPRQFSGSKRDWDLDAIINVVDNAKSRLDVHVMDYVPMYVYQKPPKPWPTIDNAIRRAADRGVRIRFLTAALHFTSMTLDALQSLQNAGKSVGGVVDIKILSVPAITEAQKAFARERRTHRKFMVSDDALLIGTSNWSGDYFANTTGVAVIMKQSSYHDQPLITQARRLFERDWKSIYASDLESYISRCYDKEAKKDICKTGRMAYQDISDVE